MGGARPALVEGLERPGQQQDRSVLQLRVGLHRFAQLVPVLPRHDHVGQDHVGPQLLGPAQRILAVVDGGDLEILGGEGDAHDLLDGDGVVR
jgi:hypothetical protein